MKFGDKISGKIERLDDKGRGVFTYPLPQTPNETRTVIVPFGVPGDEMDATFVKRDKGEWIGRLQTITHASADRITPPCPHAGVCGGCLWQHLSYDAQLRMKHEMLDHAFKHAGHPERISTLIPSPETLSYRNRMDYAVGWKGEIGLKEYGSWSHYLDLKTCLLLDEETPAILQTVRELMKEYALEPWDAKKYTGLMRYVVIRLGKNTDERLILLVVSDLKKFTPALKEEIKRRLGPLSTTLYLGEQPKTTDISYVETLDLLQGNPFLTEEVNGIRYQIHPNSFFQTNTRMAGELQRTVLTLLGDMQGKRVLDLYCGLGFFGIACAKHGAIVRGHELDTYAIELAHENARINNVQEQTKWSAGAVEKFDWDTDAPDLVIVDPPRSGLHPKALETLLEKAPPVIVYISCNYHRLVEELKKFKESYTIEHLVALDLFPQTPHVETVVKLIKKSSS